MRAEVKACVDSHDGVEHWQLMVDRVLIADTRSPLIQGLYQEMADRINGVQTPEDTNPSFTKHTVDPRW